MYLFTMALGLLLVVYGLYLESQASESFELREFSDIERFYMLEERVNLMEDFLELGESDYLLDQLRSSKEVEEEARDSDMKERASKNIKRQIENNYKDFMEKETKNLGTRKEEALEEVNMEEKYSLYSKYRSDGYSQEEICRLLDMTKGEVILLEKLSKDLK